jgi:hypothetical protein
MTPTPLQRARRRLQALVETYPELRDPSAQARLSAWLEKEQHMMPERKGQPQGDTTAYVRMQRMRQKRLASGMQTYQVWLASEDAALLTELKRPTENLSDTFARGLHALKAQRTQGSSPMVEEGMSYDARKAALVARIRALQAEGLTLQVIANRLNNEGVPTLSHKGTWKKGTVYNLLQE